MADLTLDEVLAEARRRPGSDVLAVWVRETFGESWPCGWPEPVVDRGLTPVAVTWEALGIQAYTPDEVLAIAAGLIRAALEAKEQAK